MKKIFLFLALFIIYYLFVTSDVKALSPSLSPSPTLQAPTNEVLDQQINELKERIASRVAQLKLVERRGLIGTVTDVSDTQITLSDTFGNTRFTDVDELTKFSSPSSKETFGISDIVKGSTLGILGLYNKQSQRVLARFVDVLVIPKNIHGVISSIDSKNFTLNIISEENVEFLVDVENITKTLSYTKKDGLARLGFSKLKENQNVIVIGFLDPKNKKHIIASRILVFPEIPPNPKIKLQATSSEDNIISSTGSGKKLTPITR